MARPRTVVPPGFFELHDEATASQRKNQPGSSVFVHCEAVGAFWGYKSGGSTLVVSGLAIHVTEDLDVVTTMLSKAMGDLDD